MPFNPVVVRTVCDPVARHPVVADALGLPVTGFSGDWVATMTYQPGVIVRYRGAAWAYVKTGSDRFERRLVDAPVPEADGFFVAHGFRPGEAVAVKGAIDLFAAEQGQSSGAR